VSKARILRCPKILPLRSWCLYGIQGQGPFIIDTKHSSSPLAADLLTVPPLSRKSLWCYLRSQKKQSESFLWLFSSNWELNFLQKPIISALPEPRLPLSGLAVEKELRMGEIITFRDAKGLWHFVGLNTPSPLSFESWITFLSETGSQADGEKPEKSLLLSRSSTLGHFRWLYVDRKNSQWSKFKFLRRVSQWESLFRDRKIDALGLGKPHGI
jgi:hypothetical protein